MRKWLHRSLLRMQHLAEKRLPALTRHKRAESLPILLHRRRIYVVPSRFGLAYSAMLLVMLVGSLNYANNPALLLTCLLAAATFQSVFSGFRTLNGLVLQSIRIEPVHAGASLHVSLRLASTSASPKHGLCLLMRDMKPESAPSATSHFQLGAAGERIVQVSLPAVQRGWLSIGRVRVWTQYPYGLFHVWSWLHPQQRALVYPHAEANPPALPHAGGDARDRSKHLDDNELGALREYRCGDPRRLIAWKASARQEHWLVKQFDAQSGQETALDWHHLNGLDIEARISRLTAWVELAEVAQVPYRLDLPHVHLGPALGAAHRHACLRELALMPGHAP